LLVRLLYISGRAVAVLYRDYAGATLFRDSARCTLCNV